MPERRAAEGPTKADPAGAARSGTRSPTSSSARQRSPECPANVRPSSEPRCTCLYTPLPAEFGTPDPWVYLADRYPGVKVFLRADLGQRWGQTVWRDGTPEIHLAVDLGRIQRRCTLAHEVVHVMHGAPCRPLCPADELRTLEETARWLLPDLDAVGDALARYALSDAGELLRVTRNLLTDRLDGLHDDEMAALRGRMLSAA